MAVDPQRADHVKRAPDIDTSVESSNYTVDDVRFE